MAADPVADLFRIVPQDEAQRRLRASRRLGVQRYRRIAERCLDLTPGEIAFRLRSMLGPRVATPPIIGVTGPTLARDQIVASLDRGFVLGPSNRQHLLQALESRPALRSRVLAEAHRLETDGVRIFDRVVPLGPAIDWQSDPCTGRRLWPDRPLNEDDGVRATRDEHGRILTDVKYTWEVSRHQFLVPLALAALLTSDTAMLDRSLALVDGWIEQNPPGRGVNWSSVLEVGVRAISWLWTLPLVLDTSSLDPERAARWIGSLEAHYEFLRRHLSIYTDRSNHLIGEATALWLLATVFPDLPDAGKEAARALRVLAIEIERQVTADGVSCEQAVGYHCFVTDFFLQIVSVARHQRIALPAIIESRVRAMLDFLQQILGNGGALPSIGDGDDGLGFPGLFAVTPRERAEGLLAAGSRLFDQPYRGTANGASVLTLAMGATGSAPRSASTPCSTLFRDGGYAFLEATTPTGGARQLIFDVGGLGYLPNAAHEHADALSILVRINDTLVLADPGTGTYTASPTIRNGFRGTSSHNTITVDDLDQADALETFKWLNMTSTRLLAWETGPDFDFVAASQSGYRRLREPVLHTRAILFIRPEYWIVMDRIEGRGTHRITSRHHAPPDVRWTSVGVRMFEALSGDTGDGVRLTLLELPGGPRSAVAVEPSPWSAGYGRWGTSTRLAAEVTTDANATFLTLITPVIARHSTYEVVCADPTAPAVDPVATETMLCRVRSRGGDGEDVLMIRDREIIFVAHAAGGPVERRLGTLTAPGR